MNLIKSILTFLNKYLGSVFTFPIKINGIKFYFNRLDRMVALLCWKYGILEARELKLFHSLLQEDSNFIDIGGNMGLYSFLASSKIKKGQIHTFEPDPSHVNCLNRSLLANKIGNVKIYQLAVSNKDGQMSFENKSLNGGDYKLSLNPSTTKVNTIVLDNFLININEIDIIKMDIQGAEYFALLGMKRIVNNNPELIIFLEYSPSCMAQLEVTPEKLIALIHELNLKIYEIKTSVVKISGEMLIKLNPRGIKNILLTKREL